MKHFVTFLVVFLIGAASSMGESIHVPRSFKADRLMCYWVRHNTIHTNLSYEAVRDWSLWKADDDTLPQGIELRNVSLASFPTVADLTNNAVAADAEYETVTAAAETPRQKWADMKLADKAQWYTLYLIGKNSGAIPAGWTFVRFLRFVRTNVIEAKPWEAEGLP